MTELRRIFITRCMAVLNAYDNVQYVSSWLQQFGDDHAIWPTFNPEFPYFLYHSTQHCTILIKRAAWLAFGRNEETLRDGMEDYESLIRMTAQGIRGVAIPRVMFFHRSRAGSMMKAFNPEMRASLQSRIRQKLPHIHSPFDAVLTDLSAENGHGVFVNNPTHSTGPGHSQFPDPRHDADAAQTALARGAFGQARQFAQGLILRDNNDSSGHFLLAQARHGEGLDPRATHNAYITSTSKRSYQGCWPDLLRAELCFTFGDRASGERALQAALMGDSKAAYHALHRARAAILSGAPQAGYLLAKSCQDLIPDQAQRVITLALASTGQVHDPKPIAAWRGDTEPLAKSAGILSQALACLHHDQTNSALNLLSVLRASDPDSVFFQVGGPRHVELLLHADKYRAATALIDWLASGQAASPSFAPPQSEAPVAASPLVVSAPQHRFTTRVRLKMRAFLLRILGLPGDTPPGELVIATPNPAATPVDATPSSRPNLQPLRKTLSLLKSAPDDAARQDILPGHLASAKRLAKAAMAANNAALAYEVLEAAYGGSLATIDLEYAHLRARAHAGAVL